MTRVALIGAGSVIFTKNLLGDILAFEELRDVEIALHDIDPDRLATAEAMARYVADVRGARPRISATLDRREAIEGADFVLNMVQIGGHASTLVDFEVPAHYGLRQTIADTLGIGGIFRTLRTADHMLALGNEMSALCPDAWLLNHTNPMAMLCWLVYAGTPTQNVVGLCHSVQFTKEQLCGIIGVPEDEVTILSAGVNHQAFFLRFEDSRGTSLYPALDEAIRRDPELRRRVRFAVYERFGYFPTESSEHLAEYVPWIMGHDDQLKQFRVPVDEYIRRSEANLVEYEHVREALVRGEQLDVPRSNEYASLIIHSLETGEPRVVSGNVRNDALLPGLPAGACVEVPCLVDATGLHPVVIGDYPPECAALNRTYLNVCELTVRAVLEGRRDLVYHAARLDPSASASLTLDQIDALCDDLFAAHGDLIPAQLRAPSRTPQEVFAE